MLCVLLYRRMGVRPYGIVADCVYFCIFVYAIYNIHWIAYRKENKAYVPSMGIVKWINYKCLPKRCGHYARICFGRKRIKYKNYDTKMDF